ncbi:MAG: zinc ribbon domain-containing protein [Anaerolineae bacterium]|nr:zinc ribbon domain-containing protein [Anaerolineae bacterium]MCI0607796.1 zinc ribbon domain-containing protein [Anaerolineae bacterium]
MGRRRTIGYVQNEWTCPNCDTRNKGGVKTCENCGAPQPENVQFELPSEQKLVTDEASINAAKAGADIHCGFCGTRNPATAETCSQCGADLKEGKAREAGRVMQAPAPQPKVVKCDNCGTENPNSNSVCSNCGSPLPKVSALQAAPISPAMGMKPPMPLAAKKKPNWLMIGGIIAALAVCCIAVAALLLPSKSVEATVVDVHWQTSVPVQEIQAVSHSDEPGSPPSDAYNVSCHDESRDVCEQRTIDKGNGYSEVVEECHTETQQYCSYTVDEWTTIQTYPLEGNDLRPIYESPNIASDQRIGNPSEDLTVVFSTSNGEETYSPNSVSEFQQYSIGSTWTLRMNAIGGVVSVEP